jgi:hypothetical protein
VAESCRTPSANHPTHYQYWHLHILSIMLLVSNAAVALYIGPLFSCCLTNTLSCCVLATPHPPRNKLPHVSALCRCPQPKFLTKAERQALALQRRQQETAELRAAQDEMRRLQAAQQQVGSRLLCCCLPRWRCSCLVGADSNSSRPLLGVPSCILTWA